MFFLHEPLDNKYHQYTQLSSHVHSCSSISPQPQDYFLEGVPTLDLLNHGLLSSAATADMKFDRRCSRSCTLHSASTNDNLVCANSSSSSFMRWSASTIFTLDLNFLPDNVSLLSVNISEQFVHELILF